MLELRDGNTPCWEENVGLPWTEYKHLQREQFEELVDMMIEACLLYTSPSPRDRTRSRMPSSA